ncbi:MAG: ferritin-like domain-containing protein [Candidatus Limnocylindria bacterium]
MSSSNHAAPELAGVEVHGMSRGSFLLRGALATGAALGATGVGGFVSGAFAKSGAGDVDIVNFALTLEYLEADFYKKAQTLGLSDETMAFAEQFGTDEQQHVDALTGTVEKLGGKPAPRPTFSFPINDEQSFLELAQTLEDTGVSAYNGAAPSIKSTEVLAAAGGIVQIEGRHAGIIRLLNGADPAPVAFDVTKTESQVMAAVKPLIKSS